MYPKPPYLLYKPALYRRSSSCWSTYRTLLGLAELVLVSISCQSILSVEGPGPIGKLFFRLGISPFIILFRGRPVAVDLGLLGCRILNARRRSLTSFSVL